ncbi:unnamed protein product [Moneuplotes crassus]|uniref:Uncharacterized protein n=1 Tax=Euplotes crassus TaxID=5936 RepID=A0AAD1XI44_EUPCR|nr:unnamed protein product [Moneuplotes crassus]
MESSPIVPNQAEVLERLKLMYEQMSEFFIIQSYRSRIESDGVIRELDSTEFLKIFRNAFPELITAQSSDFESNFIRQTAKSNISVEDVIMKSEGSDGMANNSSDMDCDMSEPCAITPVLNMQNRTQSRTHINAPRNYRAPKKIPNCKQSSYFIQSSNSSQFTNPTQNSARRQHSNPRQHTNPRQHVNPRQHINSSQSSNPRQNSSFRGQRDPRQNQNPRQHRNPHQNQVPWHSNRNNQIEIIREIVDLGIDQPIYGCKEILNLDGTPMLNKSQSNFTFNPNDPQKENSSNPNDHPLDSSLRTLSTECPGTDPRNSEEFKQPSSHGRM